MSPPAIVEADARVADALRLFSEGRTATLAVVDGERLVGTVTSYDVMRALRLQELMASQHPAAADARGRPPA
jgi:CBS domain-containing protein